MMDMKKVDVKEHARERELRILAKWKRENTFIKSMKQREGKPEFVFYEGPPTANGKPHIGHVLGRVMKDCLGRYKTMMGYHVVRKAGWDTHGLPVELGVEKQLGISGKKEIENYGVESFVKACKSSVFAYEKQWRELTETIGYWTDMDHPYITLTNDYIESVWHILADIHRKGLLYCGHRVSPYCPCCQTTLSSHEVAQGYETVKDLAATVKFQLHQSGDNILTWTTTPWTLPAHAALAINPQLIYARVQQGDNVYIVAKKLVENVFHGEFTILSEHQGTAFIGQTYVAPFSYVMPQQGHVIVAADFVTDCSGTGIVHMAPAHGEDDYKSCREQGIEFVTVVDAQGCYMDCVTDFAGRFVKDCDMDIIKYLAQQGTLYAKEKYEHNYPFCWRCKSPLLYYATKSWFIQTTAVQEQLIKNNNQVDWYPAHIRNGRFGRFLEDLVDWNISRNRYWGTPLNIWLCQCCRAQYAPESYQDLRNRATTSIGEQLELHKPYIDQVELHCPDCKQGVMKRTPEVIDVWFDSGSMPFAQHHYPFATDKEFHKQYPADIICEGVDQTRGWFFSLLAVSTLYKGIAPYKAVISMGHVLDEHGQKMSKSKGNVIDPWEIIHEYGTDAFRWALLSDSAPWNSKRFSKQVVAEAKSKVIDTLVNVHAFYVLYATIDQFEPDVYAEQPSNNQLDKWILSRLHSLLVNVTTGLQANDFLNPAKMIETFIDELSNWYIRCSRDRFWGNEMTVDKCFAYQTLRHVLLTLATLIAPYVPMIAEDIYLNVSGEEDSVHVNDYVVANETLIDVELECNMETARKIVELARNIRNKVGIKTRQPLSELLVIALEREFPSSVYEKMICDEINVKQIRFVSTDVNVTDYTLKLNLKQVGKKYGKHIGMLQAALQSLSTAETSQIVQAGTWQYVSATNEQFEIMLPELLIEKQAKTGFAVAANYGITIALNTKLTLQLEQEGLVREMIRGIQEHRKKLDLAIEQRIDLILDVDDELRTAIEAFENMLRANVLVACLSFGTTPNMEYISIGKKIMRVAIV